MQALQTLRFPRDRSWRGAMPCRMPSLTHNRFAHRIKDGKVCHTLLPTLNKFESVHRNFMRERGYPRLCPRSQDHGDISFSLPGMGPQSSMIRLTEFRLFGCHICPDVSETCCNNGEDLAVQDLVECLGVLKVPIQFNDALSIISGDSGQIPLEAVAFVAT